LKILASQGAYPHFPCKHGNHFDCSQPRDEQGAASSARNSSITAEPNSTW
jgi:hypothetical protein